MWSAPTTTSADRKELLRILIDDVTEIVNVDITWAGGHQTSGRNWIILAGQQQLAELRERRNRPPGYYTTRARWAPPQTETGKPQDEGQRGEP